MDTTRFTLKTSTYLMIGSTRHFFPAGFEFDSARDREIIAFLAQSGAVFE